MLFNFNKELEKYEYFYDEHNNYVELGLFIVRIN